MLAQEGVSDPAHTGVQKRCQVPPKPTADDSSAGKLDKIIIDSVDFDHASELPSTDRGGLIDAVKQQDLRPRAQWWDELNEITIRGFLQDRGYFKAVTEATPQFRFADSEGQHFAVHLHVESGIQYRLREIRFLPADCGVYSSTISGADSNSDAVQPENDNRPTLRKRTLSDVAMWAKAPGPCDHQLLFSDAELRATIKMSDGDIFDADILRKSFENLQHLYARHGFIDFVAEPEFDMNDGSQDIGLLLVLDEQQQFVYGNVQILGLDPATENSLRAKLKPGDVFNLEVLDDFFKQNATVLPFDASVSKDVTINRYVKAGAVDVTVDVRPCP